MMDGWASHIGRSFDTHMEDVCPCGQAPCGLVDSALIDAECIQHPVVPGQDDAADAQRQGLPGNAEQ